MRSLEGHRDPGGGARRAWRVTGTQEAARGEPRGSQGPRKVGHVGPGGLQGLRKAGCVGPVGSQGPRKEGVGGPG